MTTLSVAPSPVYPAELNARRRDGEPIAIRRRAGRTGSLVVACILDEFSFNSFNGEADLAPLTMKNWRAEITAAQPDLLLVESAWRGHRQTWWNTVHRHGPELTGIVGWCKERGIPTAFWNKEDPVHFNTFLTTAGMFDAVFTTDLDCVPRYKKELGHENVHFLPFAAQPAESNPLEIYNRIDGCAFAGAYYEKYPERLADLAELSKELGTEGRRFDIYDRNHGKDMPGYMFPEEYKHLIVGGALTPGMLDIPYKGYTTNLNMNSVKQSQSMFARRVFELMASNTLVVSNFSRGLRLMFGDLVVATDSGMEMRRRLDAIDAEPNGNERLRAMALRKVLREHTYAERLEFIATHAGVPLPERTPERPLFVIATDKVEEARAAAVSLQHQTVDSWCLAVIGVDPKIDDDRVIATSRSELVRIGTERDCTFLGWVDPAHWYGPSYLEDLLLAFRFADIDACGHVERFAATANSGLAHRQDQGTAWSVQPNLALHRSLLRVTSWEELPWGLTADRISGLSKGPGLAVGPVQFVADGSGSDAGALAPAADLTIDVGLPLARFREFSDELVIDDSLNTSLPELDLEAAIATLPDSDIFRLTRSEDGSLTLTADQETGVFAYWNGRETVPVPDGWAGAELPVYFDISVGLDAMFVIYYLDAAGKRIGHAIISSRRNMTIAVPEDCTRVRWGLRVSGGGSTTINALYLAPFTPPPSPLLSRSGNLVVSNIYASYDNLYRNAFVHTRLKRYLDARHRTEVVLLGRSPEPSFREFQDIDVATISPDALSSTLDAIPDATVIVHTLTRQVWDALQASGHRGRVVVWVHGFEIQPWWRRRFNYTTDQELDEAKRISDERMDFWQEVFANLPARMHFVFVSRIFAESVFEDIGARLPEEQYSIIHNPIDTDTFAYQEKDPELRKRILSIRPYHSRVYANDLAVQAVLDLKDREGFEELHFSFYGDGPLFEETVEPLRGLPNVEIHQQFLTHSEIAAAHREHGILLVPTRSDTQGVSRDEAMSSGLVPVTNAVAAIPEFVDETCGILVGGEDHQALANGVWNVAHNAALFANLSHAAAMRPRKQSAFSTIITEELKILRLGTAKELEA